eukprot:SM000005S17104  [mRNA]  locus=s5:171955:179087:+ [translate_table: standard]
MARQASAPETGPASGAAKHGAASAATAAPPGRDVEQQRQVGPEKAHSEKELVREMEKVAAMLDLHQDWTVRMHAMQRLEALVLGGAHQYGAFQGQLKLLIGPLRSQLEDRRSSIVRQVACHLLNSLAATLQFDFEACAEALLPALLKIVVITVQVIAESSDSCIRKLLYHCQLHRALPNLLEHAMHNRSSILRARCSDYCLLVLEQWSNTPEVQRAADLYGSMILCCIVDAVSEVRLSARQCFHLYARIWPVQSRHLFAKMDQGARKLVLDQASRQMYSSQASPVSHGGRQTQASQPAGFLNLCASPGPSFKRNLTKDLAAAGRTNVESTITPSAAAIHRQAEGSAQERSSWNSISQLDKRPGLSSGVKGKASSKSWHHRRDIQILQQCVRKDEDVDMLELPLQVPLASNSFPHAPATTTGHRRLQVGGSLRVQREPAIPFHDLGSASQSLGEPSLSTPTLPVGKVDGLPTVSVLHHSAATLEGSSSHSFGRSRVDMSVTEALRIAQVGAGPKRVLVRLSPDTASTAPALEADRYAAPAGKGASGEALNNMGNGRGARRVLRPLTPLALEPPRSPRSASSKAGRPPTFALSQLTNVDESSTLSKEDSVHGISTNAKDDKMKAHQEDRTVLLTALDASLQPGSSWIARVKLFDLIRSKFEGTPQEFQELSELVVRSYEEHLPDQHHKVAQAGLASLAVVMPAIPSVFETRLCQIVSIVLCKLVDAKEQTRQLASFVLQVAESTYGVLLLLPAMIKTWDTSRSPKLRTALLKYGSGVMERTWLNHPGDPALENLSKLWYLRMGLVLCDRISSVKQAAVEAMTAAFVRSMPSALVLANISNALPPNEQAALQEILVQISLRHDPPNTAMQCLDHPEVSPDMPPTSPEAAQVLEDATADAESHASWSDHFLRSDNCHHSPESLTRAMDAGEAASDALQDRETAESEAQECEAGTYFEANQHPEHHDCGLNKTFPSSQIRQPDCELPPSMGCAASPQLERETSKCQGACASAHNTPAGCGRDLDDTGSSSRGDPLEVKQAALSCGTADGHERLHKLAQHLMRHNREGGEAAQDLAWCLSNLQAGVTVITNEEMERFQVAILKLLECQDNMIQEFSLLLMQKLQLRHLHQPCHAVKVHLLRRILACSGSEDCRVGEAAAECLDLILSQRTPGFEQLLAAAVSLLLGPKASTLASSLDFLHRAMLLASRDELQPHLLSILPALITASGCASAAARRSAVLCLGCGGNGGAMLEDKRHTKDAVQAPMGPSRASLITADTLHDKTTLWLTDLDIKDEAWQPLCGGATCSFSGKAAWQLTLPLHEPCALDAVAKNMHQGGDQ